MMWCVFGFVWRFVFWGFDLRTRETNAQKMGKHIKGSCDDALPKDAYVCKKCDYVLLKEDAFVSGYDSESSLGHVHCPRCGKIVTHKP